MEYSNPNYNNTFKVKFIVKMSQNTLSTRVIKLKSFFESLAEIMGFLAGFSFISRLSKHFLVSNGVGATYDKMIAKHHEKV
jgi:hypothetical protein